MIRIEKVEKDCDVVACKPYRLIIDSLFHLICPRFNYMCIICCLKGSMLLIVLLSLQSYLTLKNLCIEIKFDERSIHDSASLLPSIWDLILHFIKSEFSRCFFSQNDVFFLIGFG